MDKWQTFMNTLTDLRVPESEESFLTAENIYIYIYTSSVKGIRRRQQQQQQSIMVWR